MKTSELFKTIEEKIDLIEDGLVRLDRRLHQIRVEYDRRQKLWRISLLIGAVSIFAAVWS